MCQLFALTDMVLTILASSYRSCFMPLQAFAHMHPHYDFIWNWEMDTRSTQDYAAMLADIERYAFDAPLDSYLDQQSRWHIAVEKDDIAEKAHQYPQDADLITLNPIFDVQRSGWYWSYDFQSEYNRT